MIDIHNAKKKAVFSNRLQGGDYQSEDIFSLDQKKIFNRSWIFAGSAQALANANDYLLLNVGEWSIIVGRYGGEIRALENRCTHRSSPIHRSEFGCRPLKCPFHGWAFNAEGIPSGIPHNQELFGYDEAQKKKLGLKRFEVGMIGDLIFIRMPDAKSTLAQFLGPMFEAMKLFNSKWKTFDQPEVSSIQANWKLIVEIALEAYHASENHPLSLGAHGQPPASVHHFSFTPHGHQVLNIGNYPNPRMMTSAATIMFLFPNFFAIQLDGKICSVLSILPQAAGVTSLRSFSFFDRAHEISSGLKMSLDNSLRMTNLEDQRVCESVQSRIGHQKKGAPLGAVEEPLYRFQSVYLKKRSRWSFFRGPN